MSTAMLTALQQQVEAWVPICVHKPRFEDTHTLK